MKKNNKNKYFEPILVGGPGRAGKTIFVDMINNQNNNNFICILLDAHLNKYLNNKRLKEVNEKKLFLKTYFETTRFVNNKNTIRKTILDSLNINYSSFEKHITYYQNSVSQLKLILSSFDFLAKIKNKKSWLALDIHSEFFFKYYKGVVPGMKFIYMFRNPVEVVCAHIYWRDYPKRRSNHKAHFLYATFLWILSYKMYAILKKKYPDDVMIFHLNRNSKNYKKLYNIDLENIKLKNNLYYNFNENKKLFYTPKSKWELLLTEKEIKFILKVTNYISIQESKSLIKFNKYFLIYIFLEFLILIGKINSFIPLLIIRYIFFPTNIIKDLVGKILNEKKN